MTIKTLNRKEWDIILQAIQEVGAELLDYKSYNDMTVQLLLKFPEELGEEQ